MSKNVFRSEILHSSSSNYFFKLTSSFSAHALLEVALAAQIIRADTQKDSQFLTPQGLEYLYRVSRIPTLQFKASLDHRNDTLNSGGIFRKALEHFVKQALRFRRILTNCACKSS